LNRPEDRQWDRAIGLHLHPGFSKICLAENLDLNDIAGAEYVISWPRLRSWRLRRGDRLCSRQRSRHE
jgi:hypothetical protein